MGCYVCLLEGGCVYIKIIILVLLKFWKMRLESGLGCWRVVGGVDFLLKLLSLGSVVVKYRGCRSVCWDFGW